ncbi:hypothetical protein [Streptomyces sp. 142MFCol3.1]|uniref:hypothetical protein n=1 Tax=Streptomyces sp. 142MFCol3.1 TaxID=1172179 RepID=UPI0003FCB743|nr:hypothetical protein [Streptomyces sp. 142MFCol3.1]
MLATRGSVRGGTVPATFVRAGLVTHRPVSEGLAREGWTPGGAPTGTGAPQARRKDWNH